MTAVIDLLANVLSESKRPLATGESPQTSRTDVCQESCLDDMSQLGDFAHTMHAALNLICVEKLGKLLNDKRAFIGPIKLANSMSAA